MNIFLNEVDVVRTVYIESQFKNENNQMRCENDLKPKTNFREIVFHIADNMASNMHTTKEKK